MSELDELKAQAEELGIKVDGRWSEAKIQEMIDAELEKGGNDQEDQGSLDAGAEDQEKAESFTVKNISKNPHLIDRNRVEIGETYTLSDRQLKDERLMAKIENGIKQNALEKV